MKIGNWPLLFQTIEHIIHHPQGYDQNSWRYVTECGTVRCIAGWIAFFGGWRDRVIGVRQPTENLVTMLSGSYGVEHELFGIKTIPAAALIALDLNDKDDNSTYICGSLFTGSLTFDNILANVRDLAIADGVTPTPLILAEMSDRGIRNDWKTP